MKEEIKGITLISLIITIVIMLILAAVALNLVLGDNGLLKKSKGAVSTYNEKKEQEAKDMKEEEKIYSLYIQDLDDLIAFRDSVNAGNTYADTTVYLVNDIDLKGSEDNQWIPIGDHDKFSVYDSEHPENNKNIMFCGAFQGNGHTISNLYMNFDSYNNEKFSSNIGLFGEVNKGYISDLTITGNIKKVKCSFKRIYRNYIGSICCNLFNSKINNCNSYVNINADNLYVSNSNFEMTFVGGLIADSSRSEICNCRNYGEIISNNARIGGVIAENYGKVENCLNYGKLCLNDEARGSIGGISNWNADIVSKSNNYGEILGIYSVNYNNDNYFTFGGIVAENDVNSIIISCENDGKLEINVPLNIIGGIVGNNDNGLIYGCKNTSKVYGTSYVGGIAGKCRYELQNQEVKLKDQGIYNSFNRGEVIGKSDSGIYVGGIVGYNNLSIINCYNTGKVTKGKENYYNSIVALNSYRGYVYNSSKYDFDTVDLKPMNITKVVNCYSLDSLNSNNNETVVKDVNGNVISDISNIEIIRKDESYMKSEDFIHDLNDELWAYRFNNYPDLKGYQKDRNEFYNK